MEEQSQLNKNDLEFEKLLAFLWLNVDESCTMENNDVVRMVGLASKKNHEKNVDDSRDSISSLSTGSAAGVEFPCIYLVKVQRLEYDVFCDFDQNQKCPPGLFVEPTPNAYLNGDT